MKTRSEPIEGQTSPPRPLMSDPLITDNALAFGARLLREVGPLPRSEHRRRRVWARLQMLPSSRQWLGRRLVYLGAAFTFSAVAASAAIGRYWVHPTTVVAGTAPATPPLAEPRPQAASVPRDPPASSESPASKPVDVDRTAPVPRKARSTATKLPVPEAEPEAAILLRAMRARRGGDTKQVEALATEYRQKHPQGVLEEEAFMLSIEAAVARRDPKARVLAREYLARFPAGRFRSQAAQAAAPSPR